ncbi:Peptidase S10 [Rubrivivax sp. A210]|uniref:S10 family peptidase n=1 Tax=Rubrivivax sp. A210 TaxID=2772301 RepID=UPI001917F7CB|nr:peptidase S10 [Rubrivivax sp. A210]CAD5372978.1 Peptidase S10 [Rubrivivax sp. A210]
MADAAPVTAAAPTPPAEPDAARRQWQAVEQLLARPAARATGSVTLGGSKHAYRSDAAFLPVAPTGLDAGGSEPEAAILATAYLLEGAEAARRPVCFAFNGGPGSASVWLHLGALGPKRVVVPDDGSPPCPPFAVQDNPHSWLEHFDLVFLDPPHTGWSLAASEAARKKMLGVDGDIEALAEAMRVWLTRHGRWGSPVYLAGESYGTTRVAGLADKMQAQGVMLSGLILVSCAMDLQSLAFAPGNDLPYALFLPAMAHTAQYHGLLAGPLAASPAAAREAAEAFVQDEYAAALQAGARLGERGRARIARRLAELTGLPRALVEAKNLRIADQTFFFEALRPRGLIVGRLDARATAPMAASRTREWEFDPGMEAIAAPYAMAALAHFRAELGLDLETRYQLLSLEVNKGWNWLRGETRFGAFTSTSPDLARALRRNPHLRVLVASGRYDLGTPYSASDWSLAHLDAPPEVRARITHRYYDAGHMMYTRQADLTKLKADLAAWMGR